MTVGSQPEIERVQICPDLLQRLKGEEPAKIALAATIADGAVHIPPVRGRANKTALS